MYVQGSIVLAEHGDVATIPRDALVQSDGRSAAFVVGSDERAALRPVQLGLTGERMVEIAAGLQLGELVVVVGANGLQHGQAVAPAPLPGLLPGVRPPGAPRPSLG
jgi:multidrug efflux pump subunit AcrA (membrane-fusion protein)